MKRKTEQQIMSAQRPEEIFTMDLEVIEEEKQEYLERFKPAEYRTIQNFMVTRKVKLFYDEAIAKINDGWNEYKLCIYSKSGEKYNIHFTNHSPFKLGEMYLTNDYIIYEVDEKYEKYYKNFIEKTEHYSKPNKHTWELVQYMVPNVTKYFESSEGKFYIFIKEPCEMYSLREILEYFEGSLKPEYVASIMTRLYYFVAYMSLVETTHNAITVDNLFFAPGRKLEDGEEYTVNDMRIVGVYGGWFFTTYLNEKLQGVPKEVYEIMPTECKNRGYSSFEVDELSIKQVAKALMSRREDVPQAFRDWINSKEVGKDPYEEFKNWEDARIKAFGKRKFVNMDISL